MLGNTFAYVGFLSPSENGALQVFKGLNIHYNDDKLLTYGTDLIRYVNYSTAYFYSFLLSLSISNISFLEQGPVLFCPLCSAIHADGTIQTATIMIILLPFVQQSCKVGLCNLYIANEAEREQPA